METTTTGDIAQSAFTQISIRIRDRERLALLQKHDTRGVADEFTIIVTEALKARGMDTTEAATQ